MLHSVFWWIGANVSEETARSFFTLKAIATHFFQYFACIYRKTKRHIIENQNFQAVVRVAVS
jgi:hypothetical protein